MMDVYIIIMYLPLFTTVRVSPLPLNIHTFYYIYIIYTYYIYYCTSRPLIFSTPAVFTAHLLYTWLSTNWLFTSHDGSDSPI